MIVHMPLQYDAEGVFLVLGLVQDDDDRQSWTKAI